MNQLSYTDTVPVSGFLEFNIFSTNFEDTKDLGLIAKLHLPVAQTGADGFFTADVFFVR